MQTTFVLIVALRAKKVEHRDKISTILPAMSDSDVMFCLQSYQGLRIDKSLVY